MTAKLSRIAADAEKRWIDLDIEGLGDFSLQVRKPTYAERMEDHGHSVATFTGAAAEHLRDSAVHRIKTTICGWKDLVQEPEKVDGAKPIEEQLEPVPFSHDTLSVLCAQFPPLLRQVLRIANGAYDGMAEEEEKNSDAESP